jgi:hypothetical protein
MTTQIITGTILDGIFMLIGQPNNVTGWLFCYVLAGFITLTMMFFTVGLPIYLLYRSFVR